jgi:hypothetical protein
MSCGGMFHVFFSGGSMSGESMFSLSTGSNTYALDNNDNPELLERDKKSEDENLDFNHITISEKIDVTKNCSLSSEEIHLSKPMNIQEALKSPIWKKSMDNEIL